MAWGMEWAQASALLFFACFAAICLWHNNPEWRAKQPALMPAAQSGSSQLMSVELASQSGSSQLMSVEPASQSGSSQLMSVKPASQRGSSQLTSVEPASQSGSSQLMSVKPASQRGSSQLTITVEELVKGPSSYMDRANHLLVPVVKRLLHQPSERPYNLALKNHDGTGLQGQSKDVMSLLSNMEGGFFIECGAFDGEMETNTLYLEKEKRWRGLLIEAQRKAFRKLLNKHRKAYTLQACLSMNKYPEVVQFVNTGNRVGGLRDVFPSRVLRKLRKHRRHGIAQVQCFPFHAVLLALEVPTVHFFSLDVEGGEVRVLETIPWKQVDIWIILVEHLNVAGDGKGRLQHILIPNGYVLVKEYEKLDLLFVRKDLIASGHITLDKLQGRVGR